MYVPLYYEDPVTDYWHLTDGVATWDVACKWQVEITGADGKTPVMVKNTHYWVGPDMIVSNRTKSRYRDWGRNWDLSGQSAEFARIDWRGPKR